MCRGDLCEQRYVRGSRAWLASMAKHRSTNFLPLLDKGVGDTNPIRLRIVDDVDLFVVQLGHIVSRSWSLVVVGRRNAEVVDLACGTQGREQIVFPAAARGGRVLGQALIGVGRANLGQGTLVGDWHFCLRHATVK